MQAISRRFWLTWGVAACGVTAFGCRAPGLGDLPLSRSFAEPNLSAESLAQSGGEDQPEFAPAANNESDGVSMTLGDQPQTVNWTSNYEEAMARAGAEGKLVLAFFTGSDFCQPCRRLHQEVVATPEFERWAAERFVLLELDYPRRTPQSPALQEQNRELLSRYGVRSFPTVLVLSAEGKAVGQNGSYRGGSPHAWMRVIDEQLSSF